MWLKEKMKNMSQGTEQLLFCIYSVVFLIIMLIGFTGDYFIIDLLFFPAFFFTLFWISRLMRLARENKSQFMKKAKKSLISIILNGFANIFSFKDYSRRTRRTKSNYFKRNKSQFMKKLPKWKAFLIIASALITAFAMVYEAYVRMVNA